MGQSEDMTLPYSTDQGRTGQDVLLRKENTLMFFVQQVFKEYPSQTSFFMCWLFITLLICPYHMTFLPKKLQTYMRMKQKT
jgi:hypothetical protein